MAKPIGNMRRNAPVSASAGKTLTKSTVPREPPARDETWAPRAPKKGSESSQGIYKRTEFEPLQTMRGRNPNLWSAVKKSMESISVRNPGTQSCRIRFSMTCSPLFAVRILRCKSCQSPVCDKARRTASSSVIPCRSISSQRSSRCAATSEITSALSPGSSTRPASRCSTSAPQSRMGHLGEAFQGAEEFGPFFADGRKLLLPLGSEAIATAAPPRMACLPRAADPAALFQPIKQRVERCQRESQRPLRLPLDAARHLIAVKRAVFQNAENRQFRRAAFNPWGNHEHSPYV